MRIRFLDSWLGLRNSTTRLPFRYGQACLVQCPQAICEVILEVDGVRQAGYSGDCLPPGWFDKSPEKDYAAQISEMLAAYRAARERFAHTLRPPASLFQAWLDVMFDVQRQGSEHGWPGLLCAFGVSLLERACIDAIARRHRMSLAKAVRTNALGIEPGRVHASLAGLEPAAWLPAQPRDSLLVRHTVGLGDALTNADVPAKERLSDGQPQTLEAYLAQSGLRYLKIKVHNRRDEDLARLLAIADLLHRYCGTDYRVTIDGNEQYGEFEDLAELIDGIRSDPQLAVLWQNTLLIEQPWPRDIAFEAGCADAIRRLGDGRPVIIDESDQELGSFAQAVACGYRGVTSKNCKSPIKSLLNAGLIWRLNQSDGARHRAGFELAEPSEAEPNAAEAQRYVMTGEDLCCVGIVPLQADLCLAATLGLEHVERNGHHYHAGLSYLPADQQQAALALHGDLYHDHAGSVRPRITGGRIAIASLQCHGFGFAVLPRRDDYVDAESWQFASLGVPAR